MSVLIKGMEMPKEPDELRLIIHPNGQVIVSHKTFYEEAEAIEMPPHGRLGDLDRLLRDFQHDPLYPVLRKYNVEGWIAGHPTIIPAEEVEA